MRRSKWIYPTLIVFAFSHFSVSAIALAASDQLCARPAEGSIVQEPPEIASKNGVLDLTLKFKSAFGDDGMRRYCYVSEEGFESPTLRVSPGDKLLIHFQNDMPVSAGVDTMSSMKMPEPSSGIDEDCNGVMSDSATNLHFHGLALPPVCHQDESIHTLVGPGQAFDYRMQVPPDNPPGLNWYHPHPHGISAAQVQGGASGALIIDGIESLVPAVATLPERTFILRDQLLSQKTATVDPLAPSWDVSINYVPIKYPKYLPATIQVNPKEKQFWRFVNAAANTIFNLQILYDGVPQTVEIFAIDGKPVTDGPIRQTVVFLPPGARMEFALTTPSIGQSAQLMTQKFDSGPTGDSAPARPLANIVIPKSRILEERTNPKYERKLTEYTANSTQVLSLLDLKPVRTRTLYFSQNGNGTEGGAGAATKFFITVVGQPVRVFDMADPPNIVVRQGTVEDWNIQNMTPEDHIFHMHQVRFQLLAVNGIPVNDPIIRDTIRVPHQVGRSPISSVKLRLDFRDPNIVGTFVYHCHILDHEDKGMMGKIQVLPANADRKSD
jgi:FtsP/CotA-like multicopper oxidase with cupredoxin domain